MPENTIDTIHLEGPLFVRNVLLSLFADKDNRSSPAYPLALPPGTRLNDEIGRSFRIATAAWRDCQARLAQNSKTALRRFLLTLFRDALGYTELPPPPALPHLEDDAPASDALHFRLSLLPVPVFYTPQPSGNTPPPTLDTPARTFSGDGLPSRRRSLSQFVQQWLNLHDDALWAIASDGRSIRLFRDNASLTRPAFLEFDLARILTEGRYADFACLYYILHASRAGSAPDASASLWETLRTKGAEEGVRLFAALRDGVVRALLHLGNGFLAAPSVRAAFASGTLDDGAFFAQLLHTAYRLLFLFTAEERSALHTPEPDPSTSPAEAQAHRAACTAYAQGYSMRRLADRCRRSSARDSHTDLWQGVGIVFRSLASGEPRLALPALGGLFRTDQAPDLDAAPLSNRALLEAIRDLRWTQSGGAAQRVDYHNLGAEELGSVYESLLELVPSVSRTDWHFSFADSVAGNSRKTSGSYYTPAPLVGQLVRSTLSDAFLDSRLKGLKTPAEREAALLSLSVLDPACGSGHFLLAAARRIAERLAQVRSREDDIVTPAAFRNALRDVVAHCIYGADLNPMAVELAKIALWIETLVPGQPLSFLDAHFAVGNSVLGVLDLKTLRKGIPNDAFKPLEGDDKTTCNDLRCANRAAIAEVAENDRHLGDLLASSLSGPSERAARIDAMPEDTLAHVEAKRTAHEAFLREAVSGPLASAADLYTAAFLLPKPSGSAVPTSADIYALLGVPGYPAPAPDTLAAASKATASARVLHWPLAFPSVFAKGGFDAILGNPPWDVMQFAEKEFFATRDPEIAALAGDERKQAIAGLQHSNPTLWNIYKTHLSTFEHEKAFLSPNTRFPLSAHGKRNLYALFTELTTQILSPSGRAGLVIQSGLASDDSTKILFRFLVESHHLESLADFENTEGIFPAVHRMFKFSLLSLGDVPAADYAFFLHSHSELADSRRHFSLSSTDFALLNPNTRTCPVFRSSRDAELTKTIYRRVPPLVLETVPSESGTDSAVCVCSPWHIRLWTMFNQTADSDLFLSAPGPNLLPLYTGKMIDLFDHRSSTFDHPGQDAFHTCTPEEKADPTFEPAPKAWVPASEVLAAANQSSAGASTSALPYLFGWRKICRAVDSRTTIAAVFPLAGAGDSLLLFSTPEPVSLQACLLADFSSLVRDWIARQKIGGSNFSFFLQKQLPTLPPSAYTPEDIDFIVPRVLELTYTSHSLAPWARALGHEGAPFPWDENRRAILRAELDARYARLYGLTRDDLLYILDPKEATRDPEFPSESFRVLRDAELSTYGEYRTARLVMSAWREQELAGIDTYVRQAAPFEEADTRKDYLKFLVRQMLRDTYSETLSVSHLYSAWAALSDPDRMAANKDMPGMTKAWAAQFKDAIRDGDNLEDILVGMCADRQISISKDGMVSLRQFPLDESLSEVRDISMDASLALIYSRKMKAAGESVRCQLSVEFVKRMEDGDFEYGIAA